MKMQLAPLLSNTATVEVLQRLLFSESKPAKLLPLDIIVLAYLIVRRCEDHEIFDSQDTIAKRVCSEYKAVARSLERLQKLGWITFTSRGPGRSKAIGINLEKFPAAQPIRDRITEESRILAREYVKELVKVEPRRRFPKGWVERQFPSAQRILTLCGGDAQLAYSMMAFAFMHHNLMKRARKSLYEMLKVWPTINCKYQDRVGSARAKTTTKEDGATDEQIETQCSRAA